MTMATLSIDRRFCGPPGSGNGGYTAGRLAALIGDPAEITLRRPPPLEAEMRIERAGSRLLLMHGDDLIAGSEYVALRNPPDGAPGRPRPERHGKTFAQMHRHVLREGPLRCRIRNLFETGRDLLHMNHIERAAAEKERHPKHQAPQTPPP